MIQQVPFINREKEKKLIDDLAKHRGTRRILFISGGGGIGKTRLIQEIHVEYRQGVKAGFSVITLREIIDFDTYMYHDPINLGHQIAMLLDKELFGPYFEITNELRKMPKAGFSLESMKKRTEEADRQFADCFNEIGKRNRIVLFFDTTDVLADGIKNYLVRLLPFLENFFLVMAGRNAEEIGSFIEDRLGEKFVFLELKAFDKTASEYYLSHKQKLAHVSLDKCIGERLVFLSDGRPILLDLAVEWLKRDIPLDWLSKMTLKDLESLPADEKLIRKREFERKLVSHISETRYGIDWLVLLMAVVYPLDDEMLIKLLDVNEDQGKKLFEEACGYVFVKKLPDGRISLHDEMRRMVKKYVWDDIDRDNYKRQDYLTRSVELFSAKLERMRETSKEEMNDSKSMEFLELERWRYKKELLNHIHSQDTKTIVELLIDLFDETTLRYQYFLRKKIAEKMDETAACLSADQKEEKYELDKRRIQYFLDDRDYKKARDLARDVLKQEYLTPEQQIEILIKKGNVEIRMGKLKQGIQNFESAVQISRENDLNQHLAHSLNARSWAHRNLGDFEQALSDYIEAYGICVEIGDLRQVVLISNNMGNIYAYKGEFETALGHCRRAIEISMKMGLKRELGLSYNSMGKIYFLSNQSESALEFYNIAIDIFESENDVEYISQVRCNRASVYLSQEKYDEALDDLNYSFENGPKNLATRILYLQSVFYENRNELGGSKRKLDECYKLSKEIGDNFFEYVCFSKMITLAGKMGEYSQWKEFREKLDQLYAHRKSEMDLRLRGTSLRGIGDLAICNGDYEDSLKAYKDGFLLIVENESLPLYSVGKHLERTAGLILRQLDKETLNKIGRDLSKFWRNSPILMRKSPEALLTFQEWER